MENGPESMTVGDSPANEQSLLASNDDGDADESSHIEMVFRSKAPSDNGIDDDIDAETGGNGTQEDDLKGNPTVQSNKCCHIPNCLMPYCPPRGRLGFVIRKVLVCFVIWAALWSVLGNDALPGGNIFSLFILLVFASLAGFIVTIIPFVTFPPLLGMLITGFLLRNIPGISVAKHIDRQWSATLRNVALVIILLRSGLGLDIQALKRLKCTVLRLAFFPCLVEAITIGIIAHFLLGMPWLWAFMLGYAF